MAQTNNNAAPSIQPVVTAAIVACVFCLVVALLVIAYGISTRGLLLKQPEGTFGRTRRKLCCQTKRGRVNRAFCSGFWRLLLHVLVAGVWILAVALLLLSCLSLAVALGGEKVYIYINK